MNLYKRQKLCIISFIIFINTILAATLSIYLEYWYVYLIFLMLSPLFNCVYSLLLYKKINCNQTIENDDITMEILKINDQLRTKSFIIFVPCYNETINELESTFNSIYAQKNIDSNSKMLLIICDGKIKNSESDSVVTTDKLLTDYIFLNNICNMYTIKKAYKTWDNKWEDLEIYCGIKYGLQFMIIIKTKNYGKRDSLTLLRKLVYNYNNSIEEVKLINIQLFKIINIEFNTIFDKRIDYIYGTDADTVLDNFCIYQLIKNMVITDEKTVAIVGFVDVNITKKNLLTLYQFIEYIYAQCLRRKFQSKFTHKVNCLSGCNQLIKVCNETCGKDILFEFNKKPKHNDNIFNMIISSASEDRNHVTIMFKLYPYIKTIQVISSIVYTNVPSNLNKFLIQRKRWTLGAVCNDILLIINKKHNIIERLQSIINVFINMINIFILVASGYFIHAIIYNTSYIMLFLCIPLFIIFMHMLLIPIFHYNLNKRIGLYYISLPLYIIGSPILSLTQHIYTIFNLDNFNWNKKDIQSNNINNALIFDDYIIVETIV